MIKRLVCVLAVCFGAQAAVAGEEALYIEVKSNGLPGFDNGEMVAQNIWILGDKMRMEDPAHRLVSIIRLDKKEVWQIDGNRSIWKKLPFEEFSKYRSEYIQRRAGIMKKIQALSSEQRDKEAARYGFTVDFMGNLRDDIKPDFKETGEKEKINGFNCRRIIFRDYGKPVFDAWVTDEVKRPENIFRFYADLGIFDNALVAEMNKVRDFPIRIEVTLDYGALFSCKAKTEVVKLSMVGPKKDAFEVPDGFKEVGLRDMPTSVPCPICGNAVEIKTAKDEGRVVMFDLYVLHVCSKACLEKLRERLKTKDIRKPSDDEEEPATPPGKNGSSAPKENNPVPTGGGENQKPAVPDNSGGIKPKSPETPGSK
jgi:hypothetical protein